MIQRDVQTKNSSAALNSLLTQREKKKKGKRTPRIKRDIHIFEEVSLEKIAN